ncbi:MAG: hypothetical protein COA63_002005 [Methylophaga sp.]|nr:hypothetical protein [Methylophaga sp.]
MNSRYKLCFLFLLFISLTAHAASTYSGDSLRKIYLEMRYLYQIGIDIHQRYDFSDPAQISACNFEVGHNSTRAKNLIGATNRIEYPDKKALIDSAWAVYACSSCKGDASACVAIPEQLKQIRSIINEQRKTSKKD